MFLRRMPEQGEVGEAVVVQHVAVDVVVGVVVETVTVT